MMNMTPAELRENEYEIRRSDLTSLSSLAMTAGDTEIELVETIESDDPGPTPSTRRARGGQEQVPTAFERLSPREREVAVLLYVQNLSCARSARCSRSPRAASARSTRS